MSKLLDEIEDEIFLAMLAETRNSGERIFDLHELCNKHGIEANVQTLVGFVNNYDGTYGSKERSTLSSIKFEIDSWGVRRAREIEESRNTPKFIQKLTGDKSQKLVNVINTGIALLALAVAVAAFFRDPA